LMPLFRAGWVAEDPVLVTGLSGVSGAGSTPAPRYHFPECTENVQPYGIPGHRHVPEMEQELSGLAGRPVSVCFTPHLVPMSRGILITAVATLAGGAEADRLQELYASAYGQEPFVRVLGPDELPKTRAVWGSNYCDVAVRFDARTGKVVALAAIDNLVKGAAGQAIQNMNLMLGLPESTGLTGPGLCP
ncbi:MAG TPA: Asd/ArgC dimerization domain-containing protein, partial [Limnochordia bacterium]